MTDHIKDLPPHITLGSKWRERSPYQYRVVTVVGWNPYKQKVVITCGPKTTLARADRFGRDYKLETV